MLRPHYRKVMLRTAAKPRSLGEGVTVAKAPPCDSGIQNPCAVSNRLSSHTGRGCHHSYSRRSRTRSRNMRRMPQPNRRRHQPRRRHFAILRGRSRRDRLFPQQMCRCVGQDDLERGPHRARDEVSPAGGTVDRPKTHARGGSAVIAYGDVANCALVPPHCRSTSIFL
jgi:hypothetical protein